MVVCLLGKDSFFIYFHIYCLFCFMYMKVMNYSNTLLLSRCQTNLASLKEQVTCSLTNIMQSVRNAIVHAQRIITFLSYYTHYTSHFFILQYTNSISLLSFNELISLTCHISWTVHLKRLIVKSLYRTANNVQSQMQYTIRPNIANKLTSRVLVVLVHEINPTVQGLQDIRNSNSRPQ